MKKRIVRYLRPYFPYMLMMIFCAFITVAVINHPGAYR